METPILYFIISTAVGLTLVLAKLLYKTHCKDINLCWGCFKISRDNDETPAETTQRPISSSVTSSNLLSMSNIYPNSNNV
jgi:hypothetical protein